MSKKVQHHGVPVLTWQEQRLFPIEGTTRVLDGYVDVCESCEDWGEKCEFCDAFVPITCDLDVKEVTMAQMTLCGIPTGHPKEIKMDNE